jgi:hypothetical protein
MQTEPPKAAPPKRKRRWFQFSLRTLMIGVTVLAILFAYIGSQLKFMRERHEAAASHQEVFSWVIPAIRPEAPWPLRWFGEEAYLGIDAGNTASDDEIANLKLLFPEAVIWRGDEKH